MNEPGAIKVAAPLTVMLTLLLLGAWMMAPSATSAGRMTPVVAPSTPSIVTLAVSVVSRAAPKPTKSSPPLPVKWICAPKTA